MEGAEAGEDGARTPDSARGEAVAARHGIGADGPFVYPPWDLSALERPEVVVQGGDVVKTR